MLICVSHSAEALQGFTQPLQEVSTFFDDKNLTASRVKGKWIKAVTEYSASDTIQNKVLIALREIFQGERGDSENPRMHENIWGVSRAWSPVLRAESDKCSLYSAKTI